MQAVSKTESKVQMNAHWSHNIATQMQE